MQKAKEPKHLTLLHSERPKLSAILSAIGLRPTCVGVEVVNFEGVIQPTTTAMHSILKKNFMVNFLKILMCDENT